MEPVEPAETVLHFLILFGEFFNGGCKSLDLLGQGRGIWIRLRLNIEVNGNYVFKYESENVVPTDSTKLVKRDFVSRIEHAQMDPNPGLDAYEVDETASIMVVTGVVPATMSPMPKSERESIL